MEVNARSVAKVKLARKLRPEEIGGRTVSQNEFLDHLNETIIIPNLGFEASREAMKNIVDGIGNQIAFILNAGGEVKLGSLGTFKRHVCRHPALMNNNTGRPIEPGTVFRVSFTSSSSTRGMMRRARQQTL